MEVVRKLISDMPGASVKDILEKARAISIQNSILEIQAGLFETPFHIIDHLLTREGKTPEDIVDILTVVAPSYAHVVSDFCAFSTIARSEPPAGCFSLRRKKNI